MIVEIKPDLHGLFAELFASVGVLGGGHLKYFCRIGIHPLLEEDFCQESVYF
ncbi:hypothetical protein FE840_007335 [Peteryoungia desertarenae]|uniref:Uncharacterized protein n=1 Tax=Peteryoungia desertarenae TaxID=1813451 RepID=A0ABX6QL93_9HYPH|nr:hypothetical protein [Peteryoungia desertarenae]QLF69368.1 hypothetical protein FE840_007335 [Peteryoungia desertarenae]